MTLNEIKTAVNEGKKVFWANTNYEVIRDNIGQWLIRCKLNDYCIGLTWLDNVTMNGEEKDFFVMGSNDKKALTKF